MLHRARFYSVFFLCPKVKGEVMETNYAIAIVIAIAIATLSDWLKNLAKSKPTAP